MHFDVSTCPQQETHIFPTDNCLPTLTSAVSASVALDRAPVLADKTNSLTPSGDRKTAGTVAVSVYLSIDQTVQLFSKARPNAGCLC